MARRYSGRKGKSGSTKPSKIVQPAWVNYKGREVELLVTKLAKEGKNSSQIGSYLRDAYGIPNVRAITKKTITQIMKEKKLMPALPEDLLNLMKRALKLRKHIDRNKKDQTGKRGLILTESKIRSIVKYYKKTKKLPTDWKYNPDEITMYLS